jgi:hypothetical protein
METLEDARHKNKSASDKRHLGILSCRNISFAPPPRKNDSRVALEMPFTRAGESDMFPIAL